MTGLPKIDSYPLPQEAELPAARGAWRVEADRAVLLIHDMQNYFVGAFDQGSEPIAPVIANIAALAAHCRAGGVPVFYTAQNGNQDRRDRGLQADIWGPGMTTSPEHQGIVDALAPASGDFVLTKHRYSAFQRSNLETMMRARGRDQIVITGIYAHIGCMMTAAEAFQLDIETFIAADAVADFSRAQHDMALNWIAGRCGVPLSTAGIVGALGKE